MQFDEIFNSFAGNLQSCQTGSFSSSNSNYIKDGKDFSRFAVQLFAELSGNHDTQSITKNESTKSFH